MVDEWVSNVLDMISEVELEGEERAEFLKKLSDKLLTMNGG